MTLIFLDIALQHLQPWIPQPAEWPSKLGVTGMVIGSMDCMGSSTFLSLALTSFLLSVLLFSGSGKVRVCILLRGLVLWFSLFV